MHPFFFYFNYSMSDKNLQEPEKQSSFVSFECKWQSVFLFEQYT